VITPINLTTDIGGLPTLSVGNLLVLAGLQATIEANRQSMVKQLKGRKLKTAKAGGAEIIRFKEELEASGKYSEQHIKNTCTTFLKGVNENKPFSFNPYRAKGAKSSEANTISVKLTIKGEPTESEVASMLRDLVQPERNLLAPTTLPHPLPNQTHHPRWHQFLEGEKKTPPFGGA